LFSIEFLNELRDAELKSAVAKLRPNAHVLEFGAGTGIQAGALSELGYQVTAIDLPSSGYANDRIFPVIDYDGVTIPVPDKSVDVIYSSNVLEHVVDFPRIASEFRRVTKPDGYGVHLMPTVSWRAWTFSTGLLNAAPVAWAAARDLLSSADSTNRASRAKNWAKMFAGSILPIGHGTSVEGFSELWTFSAAAWRARFRENGFVVDEVIPTGIFHTGHQLLGRKLGIDTRRALARRLGSAANLYIVRSS